MASRKKSRSRDGAELTIDRLARKTGMTARNIRAHQSRGLLPPPEVKGRVGYYGPDHVARLELIKEMQADGFNLEAIARLLERSDDSSEEVLRFTRALRRPFAEERPRVVTLEELAEPIGDADPEWRRSCWTTRSRSDSCTRSATTASRISAPGSPTSGGSCSSSGSRRSRRSRSAR